MRVGQRKIVNERWSMNKEKALQLPPYRIGHGYDVHRFGEGDFIMLGGVKIAHHHGLVAHSDGDVLIHALCDALLGSVAAGDIGHHFPDCDEQYRNVDSSILLESTVGILKKKNYLIVNVDITIVAQRPKISPYIEQIRNSLSGLLSVSISQVNIKATTTEGLGFVGREQGIAVHAVVMVYSEAPC